MIIEYEQWKNFRGCPKLYYLRHRAAEIPGIPDSDYFRIRSKLTHKFFSMFSNIWKHKSPYMPVEYIREKLSSVYDDLLKILSINWGASYVIKSKEQIFEEAYNDICAVMDSQNQNYFLNTKSDVEISVTLSQGHILKGVIDFIRTDPVGGGDIVFVDSSSKIEKKPKLEKVLFPAVLYYYHFNRIPESLGIFYYRFNTFFPVESGEHIIIPFIESLSGDIEKMRGNKYEASPNHRTCKHCGYRNSCVALIKKRSERTKSLSISTYEGTGVQEFGL